MNYYDYVWDKAVKIALRCLAEGGVTKSLMRKQGKDFGDLMVGDYVERYQDKRTEVYDGYGDLIRETCDNEIPIPKSCYPSLIKEIENEFGDLKSYAKMIGLNPKEHLNLIVSDWAWDMLGNPDCILLKDAFWDEVWQKLPEGKMSGYQTRTPRRRAPAKKCPVKVDFRKML